VPVEGGHVGQEVLRPDEGPVPRSGIPDPAREGLGAHAELEEEAAGGLAGGQIGHRGFLERCIQAFAVRADRHGLEAAAVRLRCGPCEVGIVRRPQAARGGERWIQQLSGGVDVQDPWSELVAEP
jgi:hypothetical protein